MSEQKTLKLDSLRNEIRQPLQIFADKLTASLGDNLKSLTVVGSSLTEDFRPGKSDINTVLVVEKQDLELLNVLASMGKMMGKKKLRAPILMTPGYIEQSRDVFGVEFLDFQLIHQTILGDDPFEDMKFDKHHIRLQCERELKASLIRLRQGYIAAANNNKMITMLFSATVAGLLPLLRAVLWLKDESRPKNVQAVFKESASIFSIDTDILAEAKHFKYEKTHLAKDRISKIFDTVYKTVEQLADLVDKLEV